MDSSGFVHLRKVSAVPRYGNFTHAELVVVMVMCVQSSRAVSHTPTFVSRWMWNRNRAKPLLCALHCLGTETAVRGRLAKAHCDLDIVLSWSGIYTQRIAVTASVDKHEQCGRRDQQALRIWRTRAVWTQRAVVTPKVTNMSSLDAALIGKSLTVCMGR